MNWDESEQDEVDGMEWGDSRCLPDMGQLHFDQLQLNYN